MSSSHGQSKKSNSYNDVTIDDINEFQKGSRLNNKTTKKNKRRKPGEKLTRNECRYQ